MKADCHKIDIGSHHTVPANTHRPGIVTMMCQRDAYSRGRVLW